MYEKPAIPEEHLRACLQDQYNVSAATLEFLPLGLDSRAGVYRVVGEQGSSYLLKARLGPLYEPACLVSRYLHDQGITSVVAPLFSQSQTLWTHVEDWTVIVYPFIDGDTNWTGMTGGQWKETGSIFKQIHQVVLPSFGFETLRKETFDPTEYIRWIQMFETHHLHSQDDESVFEHAVRTSWRAHQPAIHTVVTYLEKLSEVLQKRSGSYVICHADLHPANLLRTPANRVFVLDWDEVMLAPKERDFIFVNEGLAGCSTMLDTSPFFQGYGQTEIDWIALTYYRYERVVQDLIESAKEVFFREDLGEETRAASAQLFHEILAERGEIDAAHTAATHLPSDLNPGPSTNSVAFE